MTQVSDSGRPAPYKLSAVLAGHENDVRCVTARDRPSPQLATASRDGTVRLWQTEEKDSSWRQAFEWREQERLYENAVAFVPPASEGEDGYLATAGADALIQLFALPESGSPPSKPAYTLLGHAHNVCALDVSHDGKRIASASWDMTARVWSSTGGEEGWTCETVLVDHQAAVWDVLFLRKEPHLLLTASADSRIRLFDLQSAETVSTFKGHVGPVRSLAKLLPGDPDCALFASASNDCTIMIWNYQTGDSLTTLGTHDSFIYSLTALPAAGGGGLASAGEDGIIKIWNEQDGELDQEILVPALSVWSVAALPNGDLACACSDNLVWIFTRASDRHAGEATTSRYEEQLAQRKLPAGKAEPKPVVHDAQVLEEAGAEEDEVKLVQQDERVLAYQWSEGQWRELGEMVGGVEKPAPPDPPSKMQHDGVDYDFVFSIDVKDDEPPLPLPYNHGDDVDELAASFVRKHELPESYVERIVDFVRSTVGSAG
ncbi:hypothetical protein JCM8202_003047 [Rhodotorula sphaerocarpa]